MKYTLAQLRKFTMPYAYDEELDLSSDLDGFEDIISSKPCQCHTVIRERGIDTYSLSFNIKIELIMEDAVTLEEIPYIIETEAEEIFTTDDSIEDAFIIDGITIDTKEAILTNILINKPMSVSDSDFVDEDDSFTESAEDDINPAFASLKDLL